MAELLAVLIVAAVAFTAYCLVDLGHVPGDGV